MIKWCTIHVCATLAVVCTFIQPALINNNLLYELKFVEYFNVIVCVKKVLMQLMLFSTFYIQRASHQHQQIWIQIRMQIATSTFNTLQEYLRFRMEAHDVGPMAKKQKVRSKHFSNQFFIMTENYIKHFSVNMRCYMRPVYVGYIVQTIETVQQIQNTITTAVQCRMQTTRAKTSLNVYEATKKTYTQIAEIGNNCESYCWERALCKQLKPFLEERKRCAQ